MNQDRKEYDRARYLRDRETRCQHQREYYHANREAILQRKHKTGVMTYGTARQSSNYE